MRRTSTIRAPRQFSGLFGRVTWRGWGYSPTHRCTLSKTTMARGHHGYASHLNRGILCLGHSDERRYEKRESEPRDVWISSVFRQHSVSLSSAPLESWSKFTRALRKKKVFFKNSSKPAAITGRRCGQSAYKTVPPRVDSAGGPLWSVPHQRSSKNTSELGSGMSSVSNSVGLKLETHFLWVGPCFKTNLAKLKQ